MSADDVRMLLKIISDSLNDMDNQEIGKLYNGLCSGVGSLIHKIDIVNRLKDYYPIGYYVHPENCKAEWNDDILYIHIEGWKHTIISYKYVDGLYYKCNISSWNINGRGTPINETFGNCKGLTEKELFQDVSMIKD
jgi:hypothetical protein